MLSAIRSVTSFIEKMCFFGYNELLEKHKNEKIPTTFVFGENVFQNLYIVDYDRHFLVLRDNKGIVLSYNRDNLLTFGKTVVKPKENNDQVPQ